MTHVDTQQDFMIWFILRFHNSLGGWKIKTPLSGLPPLWRLAGLAITVRADQRFLREDSWNYKANPHDAILPLIQRLKDTDITVRSCAIDAICQLAQQSEPQMNSQ